MLVKFLHSHKIPLQIAGKVFVLVVKILLVYLFTCLFVSLFVCFLFALLGLACLAWGVFLPLLALLVIAGVVRRCLFSAWRYLALFGFAGVGFAGVAGRSCTLPFANALSVSRLPGSALHSA